MTTPVSGFLSNERHHHLATAVCGRQQACLCVRCHGSGQHAEVSAVLSGRSAREN